MPYFYGIDTYYLVLVLPAILLSLWAQASVKGTFAKFSKVDTMRRLTGAAAAEQVLKQNGLYDVKIERVSGNLTDHYDPRTNVIRLSDSVHGSTSVAAVGVAAHEAGHAVQHGVGYSAIKVRNAVLPVAQIGSTLSVPLIFVGLLLNSNNLFLIGIIAMAAAVLFQLITLPVEFDASHRAIEALSTGMLLYEDEIPGAKKVLRAAAMTYVAALAVSVMQLLRFILLYGNRRRR